MKNLNGEELKDFISKGGVIVDFWAPWCGPCQMLGPVFEELSREIKNVNFAKVNIDDDGESAMELGVRGVPTLILFKDGEEVDRIVGFLPKDVLKTKIEETFN